MERLSYRIRSFFVRECSFMRVFTTLHSQKLLLELLWLVLYVHSYKSQMNKCNVLHCDLTTLTVICYGKLVIVCISCLKILFRKVQMTVRVCRCVHQHEYCLQRAVYMNWRLQISVLCQTNFWRCQVTPSLPPAFWYLFWGYFWWLPVYGFGAVCTL